MKFLVLLVLVLAGCSTAPVRTSDYCLELDKKLEFGACEAKDVICYKMGNIGSCYLKQQPAPVVTPAPVVEPVKATKKK